MDRELLLAKLAAVEQAEHALPTICGLAELPVIDAQRLRLRQERDRLQGLLAAVPLAAVPPRNYDPAPEAEEPLTDSQEAVFQIILEQGPVSGKEICNQTGGEETTLRRHIIPALKEKRGVRNRRGAGYYLPVSSAQRRHIGAT